MKKIISNEYLIDVLNIEKNKESTVGNVYMIYTKDEKYVLKIYDDINHAKSMALLSDDLSNKFYIPKAIKNRNNNLYTSINNKYLVLYSFLEGVSIGELALDKNIIKQLAIEVRRLHDLTHINKYELNGVPFEDYNLERKSLLHFDLTKGNIFYNNKIGFIDFDDAKYGSSVCDVAILVALIFFSKKRGIDVVGLNTFIDNYYGSDNDIKLKEIKYIKSIALNWINYTLSNNDFMPSTKESFEVKKKLIEEFFIKKELKSFGDCINKEVYQMYQDIPCEEVGSINKLNSIKYEDFIKLSEDYIKEEININLELGTTTKRYILYVDNYPVGEVGIRTTQNDFWKNKGSQIFYKIRKSERGKGYGNIILSLALKEAAKLGFKQIRINCDNNNIASKKIILKNGGKEDIINYKTKDGYSTSYIIDMEG